MLMQTEALRGSTMNYCAIFW